MLLLLREKNRVSVALQNPAGNQTCGFTAECSEVFFKKKSELMLMRRAKIYSSFCSQVVLVYSIYFFAIHCSAAENCKKSPKVLIWGKGGSR